MSAPAGLYAQLLQVATEGAHRALYERCDDGVQAAETVQVDGGEPLLEGLGYPAMCVTAERADGAPGGLCLCASAAGARALAIRSLDPLPPEASEEPLGAADLEAAQTWGAEVVSAVSAATSAILGEPLALAEPAVRVLTGPDAAPGRDPDAPVVLRVSLSVHGERCLLLLSLPASDEEDAGAPPPSGTAPAAAPQRSAAANEPGRAGAGPHGGELAALPHADIAGALSGTRVPVWAEIGQVRLPLRRATAIPVGEVVELDCEADAPVDLYVNGLRFARGELIITADGEWALRIAELDSAAPPS